MHIKFKEILDQYEFWNKEGKAYLLFEHYKDWFIQSIKNESLKSCLLETLNEVIQTKDLNKYDFVLLVIQAFEIDFSKKDEHFELLFFIADSIMEDFAFSVNGDKESWLLHQLMDICIHHAEEIEKVFRRNAKLIPRVVRKIGRVKYESSIYGPQMYFAAYKSVGLILYMPNNEAKEILNEIFLKHFDKRVVEEANEIIEYLEQEVNET